MISHQDLHYRNLDLCDLVVDVRSQGHSADYRLSCPLCGSESGPSNGYEIGIKLHDDARICQECLDALIPGSVSLLEQIAFIHKCVGASSNSTLLIGAAVALLDALSAYLKANSDSVGVEINGQTSRRQNTTR